MVGGRTGSSELASGNSSVFSEVDFAWAGPAKIDFEQEILVTQKGTFHQKVWGVLQKMGRAKGGSKIAFLNKQT